MSVFGCLSSIYKALFALFSAVFSKLHKRVFHNERIELFSTLYSLANDKKGPLKIVEIGSGTGINFEYFPEGSFVICLDPNPYMFKFVKPNHDRIMHIEHVLGYAEDMKKITSNSVDVVVSTLVMCSVSDVDKSIAEVKRILKPGGIYLFMEHVIDEKNSVLRQIQVFLNPLWSCLFDGCNLTIDLARHLDNAGFSHITHKYICMPYNGLLQFIAAFPLIRMHLIGCAKK